MLNASAPPKALNKKRPQFLKRDCWKCCLAKFFPLPAATLLAWRTNTTLLCMKPDMRLSAALTDFRYMLFLLTHPPAELLASHWPVWIFPIMLWRIFSMVWRLVAEVLKRNSFWVLRPTPVMAAACEIIDYGYRNILGEYNLSEVTPDRCVRLVSSTLKQRYEYELADITEKGRFMARETLEFFGEEMVRKVAKAMLVNPRKMLLQK